MNSYERDYPKRRWHEQPKPLDLWQPLMVGIAISCGLMVLIAVAWVAWTW